MERLIFHSSHGNGAALLSHPVLLTMSFCSMVVERLLEVFAYQDESAGAVDYQSGTDFEQGVAQKLGTVFYF
jgi:hypothetical protein